MSDVPIPGESAPPTPVRPPADPREAELFDQVLGWLQVNVLRLIVTKVAPLIVGSGVVVSALAWLQDAIGVDLPTSVVAAFVVTVMAGVVATAFAYVKNHDGAAKLGTALLHLLELRERGAGALGELPPGEGKYGGFKY